MKVAEKDLMQAAIDLAHSSKGKAPHAWTPESRAKLSATLRGRKYSAEHREAIRQGLNRPEVREKRRASAPRTHSPEHNAKVRDTKRAHRLGMSALHTLPEAARVERVLMQQILDLAKMHGWLAYHPWLSVHSEPGFPDIIAVRDGRVLAIEVKSAKGKATKSQRAWLEQLNRVPGVDAMIVRPGPNLDELGQLLR